MGEIKFFFILNFNGLISQPELACVEDERMLVICMTSGGPIMIGGKEL